MAVEQWVKDIVADIWPSSMKVGDIVKHPDGRYVQIVDGHLWTEGGFSNFWYWREVKRDGTLGRLEHGYGW